MHSELPINIFYLVAEDLKDQGFTIINKDLERPWGGFFVIDEDQAKDFVAHYFSGQLSESLVEGQKVSPKILVVAPHCRLSWQYHFRRSEVWTVLDRPVGIMRSDTDEEGELVVRQKGETITLAQGERHRLVGLDDWGVVAEIWRHTDPNNPSDETDIVRLQDDYGRTTPAT